MTDSTPAGTPDDAATRAPATSRLVLLFIALALVVPLIGFVFVKIQTPQIEREAYGNLQAIARLKAEQIESWLGERRGDGKVLAASREFNAQVHSFLQDKTDKNLRREILDHFQSLHEGYGYDTILLLDSRGDQVLNQGGMHLDRTPATHDLVALAITSKQLQRGELYRGDEGHVHLDWVVPVVVSDARGERAVAAILLRIVASEFLYPLIQTWPTASASAESLLVRREGESAIFLNELRHRRGTALILKLPATSPDLPAAIAIRAAGPGTVRGTDHRGVDVLAAYRPIAGTDWHIVAKVDRDEVLAPLWSSLYWVGLIALAAVAAIMLALLLLWRQQQRSQALELLAQKGKADRLLATLADNSSDTIFIKDLEGRYLLINPETARILGKTAAQALGRDDAALFPPAQAEMISANDRRVIAENRINTYEETLATVDGERIYLATKGPLRDGEGQVIGMFGIARDITDRQQAEMALRQTIEELERFNRVAVGRELDMISLKQQVNALSRQLGLAAPYALDFADPSATGARD